MADREGGEENIPRGNEWEVVSLTASAYAAAPGPKEYKTKDGDGDGDGEGEGEGEAGSCEEEEAETSRALFMSGHFVFPPKEHENLPLEPLEPDNSSEPVGKDLLAESGVEEGGRSRAKEEEEDWSLKGLNVHDEFPDMHFYKKHPIEFEEGTTLQGLDLIDKYPSLYSDAAFSSLHIEEALGGSATYGEDTTISELVEASEQDVSLSPESVLDDKYKNSDLPCEAWWKRRAVSLYAQAKEANAFWSIFIAAAVMGIVIVGQRWQQERWQALQLKWQLSINNEKTGGRVLGSISRLKDVIVGGHRRSSFVRGSSQSDS